MAQDIAERVRDFIVDELGYVGARADLTKDYPLLDAQVIDSLSLFEIVAFIEASFDVQIDDEDVTAENFETLDAIERFVRSRSQDGSSLG